MTPLLHQNRPTKNIVKTVNIERIIEDKNRLINLINVSKLNLLTIAISISKEILSQYAFSLFVGSLIVQQHIYIGPTDTPTENMRSVSR